MSPPVPHCKAQQAEQVTSNATVGRSTGCSNEHAEGGAADPELAALVVAWPTLPAPIRAAVRALIGTVTGPTGNG